MDNFIIAVLIVVLIIVIYRTNKKSPQPEVSGTQGTVENQPNNAEKLTNYHPPYFLIDPDCPYDDDDPLYYLCAYDPYIPYRSVVYPYNNWNNWGGYGRRPPNWNGHMGHRRPIHPGSRPGRPMSPRPGRPMSPRPSRPMSPRPGRGRH